MNTLDTLTETTKALDTLAHTFNQGADTMRQRTGLAPRLEQLAMAADELINGDHNGARTAALLMNVYATSSRQQLTHVVAVGRSVLRDMERALAAAETLLAICDADDKASGK